MVNFAPVTPEIKVWEIFTFETIRQKRLISLKYLDNYWTDLYQRFSFGRCMYGDYKTDTTAPSGLYARLCHAFLVTDIVWSETEKSLPCIVQMLDFIASLLSLVG